MWSKYHSTYPSMCMYYYLVSGASAPHWLRWGFGRGTQRRAIWRQQGARRNKLICWVNFRQSWHGGVCLTTVVLEGLKGVTESFALDADSSDPFCL